MSVAVDRRAFLLMAPALGLAFGANSAVPAAIPLAADLRGDGRQSRSLKAPLVILFSLPRCPYCEIVRRSYLLPMLRDPEQSGRAILRQIDIGLDHPVVGFAGERTTHSDLARRHGVSAAPVVAFWDGEGKALAEPLRGMLLPDFYGAYLEAAIDAARARLASRN